LLRTYREHLQLASVVQELAGLIEAHSRRLHALARREALPAGPPDDSPLHATWPDLRSAFQLLANHARSLQAEFERLNLAASENTS
jgi:hypothetical protein